MTDPTLSRAMTAPSLPGPYETLLRRLYALEIRGEKFDLHGPRELHRALGAPATGLRSVIIGGTNGKGSTSAFLEGGLSRAGFKTGLFTSPHLISFCERIRIQGMPLRPQDLVTPLGEVLECAETLGNSFFETTWALAARIFEREEVDVAIWEVGLGGRLDATNVLEPEISALVSIDFDHTDILGSTLEDIAREKTGIFRQGGRNLTTATGAGLAAIRRVWSDSLTVVPMRPDLPDLALKGVAQQQNASLALAICDALGVIVEPETMASVQWPGRGEFVGDVFLDCAHNPAGIASLLEVVRDVPPPQRHLVFGAVEGKDVPGMAALLGPAFASITLVTPDYPRGRRAQDLEPLFAGVPRLRVEDSISVALDQRPPHELTVVCGSCFVVGEARAHLLGVPYPECGIRTACR